MKDTLRYYLKLLAVPLSFFAFFATLFAVWHVFDMPSDRELFTIVQGWFEAYGLPAVFVSALIEGMLLVGGYYPGVFVIFFGVILAGTPGRVVIVVAVVTAGLFLAHLINYALGRYGWYRLLVKFGLRGSIEQAKAKLLKRGPMAIAASYWMPSIAAVTDTAAGIMHMPFRRFFFYSLIAVTAWDIFFGTLVYFLGGAALAITKPGGVSTTLIAFSIFVVWVTALLIIDRREKEKQPY